MDDTELRGLYQSTMDRLLFFSNDDSLERRKIYEDIFLETWGHIPATYHENILENLEFILCKKIVDIHRSSTPACTLPSRISFLCFIIFDPFADFLKHETKVHILAHEFAHVYYKHPCFGLKIRDESGPEKEKEYIDREAEPQAYALGKKWKILPHPDDIHKLTGYKKFVLKET